MKWRFEQTERGALPHALPRNQPGGLCGAPAPEKLHRIPRTWGWRGPGERGEVPSGDGAVPLTETAGSHVLGGAALAMFPAWGAQGAAGAACSARGAALGRAHRPALAVQQPAMPRGTAPGAGTRLPPAGVPHRGCCRCCREVAPRCGGAPGGSTAQRRRRSEGKGDAMWSRIFRRCSKRGGCSGNWVPDATPCTLSPRAPIIAVPGARCRACPPSAALPRAARSWLGRRAHIPVWNMQHGDNRAKCNHCLQKKLSRIYLLEVTEEYEFYTPFKMLFISLSLGALSTSNFTHSYNSPPNSSCFSSGFLRSHFGLCSLPVQLVQWLETVTRR